MRLGTGEREASSWVRAFCRRGPRICKRRDSGGWISARLRLRVTGGLGSNGGDRSAEEGRNGRDWRGVRGVPVAGAGRDEAEAAGRGPEQAVRGGSDGQATVAAGVGLRKDVDRWSSGRRRQVVRLNSAVRRTTVPRGGGGTGEWLQMRAAGGER
ncbi:hypothetical protein EUGRSUZ_L00092 [Eucalyptus grandis]|uniref:Uncharacterized protein n=1 Tax=Eucalyptus grandis TaxID=71139 RepID=A0A058ZW86_EUCGR|nr:hypothetical protein EUGRSUZ_L00092 [Eucalyptus grandis]